MVILNKSVIFVKDETTSAMKTTTQIKAEHPEWNEKQISEEFDKLMTKDMHSIGNKLRKMKEILDTDPIYSKDEGAEYWSDVFKDCANLIDPDLSGFGIMDLNKEETEVFVDRLAKFNHSQKAKKD